jgi:AraC-like DNA-binding protein
MDRRVRKIIGIIHERWHQRLRIGELAGHVGLGASRLEHLFKDQASISIRDYIRERRLTAAAALLAETEERVSVISWKVGFPDVSNFNHAFKKRFGLSPREYREQHPLGVSSFHHEEAEQTK